MKLLSKDDITKAKSLDTSREVNEGLKISRSVDALRRIKVDEEASFEQWRTQSLEAIQREITEAEHTKALLLTEVRLLQEDRATGLAVVVTKSQELATLQEKLESLAEDLQRREEEIRETEKHTQSKQRQLDKDVTRQKTRLEESQRLHAEANLHQQETQAVLNEVEKVKEETLKAQKEGQIQLEGRIAAVLMREKTCFVQEQENKRLSEELATQKVQLEDGWATLEREKERSKK